MPAALRWPLCGDMPMCYSTCRCACSRAEDWAEWPDEIASFVCCCLFLGHAVMGSIGLPSASPMRAADENGQLRVTLEFIKDMLQVGPAGCTWGMHGACMALWCRRSPGCIPHVGFSPSTPCVHHLQAFKEERLIHRRYAFEIILQVGISQRGICMLP